MPPKRPAKATTVNKIDRHRARSFCERPARPCLQNGNLRTVAPLYIQKDSPGKTKEANWLPAPNDPIYLLMRLYWPKDTPHSILPDWRRNVEATGCRDSK
jgi:Protein of unknown function (DUF1214)